MIASKFGIGQQVRHTLLGYLGVVVDIDPEYSLDEPLADELAVNAELRAAPWYHVVMEGDDGQPVHTYLAEAQLSSELQEEHPEQPTMDELAQTIRKQLQAPRLRNCVKKPDNGLFFITSPAPDGDVDRRTAIHDDLQPRIPRQHGGLLVNHAQLHPQRFRPYGDSVLRHFPRRLGITEDIDHINFSGTSASVA